MINKQTMITQDPSNKKLKVVREFDAPVEQVWKAWTQQEILDQWWAPKPWKARTKSIDFRAGGSWLYAMEGPAGERHWAIAEYDIVEENKRFTGYDSFSDENGNKTADPPSMHWDARFSPSGQGTRVEIDITFASEDDLRKIVEMGFKEGFTAAHGNLDELLQQQTKNK